MMNNVAHEIGVAADGATIGPRSGARCRFGSAMDDILVHVGREESGGLGAQPPARTAFSGDCRLYPSIIARTCRRSVINQSPMAEWAPGASSL